MQLIFSSESSSNTKKADTNNFFTNKTNSENVNHNDTLISKQDSPIHNGFKNNKQNQTKPESSEKLKIDQLPLFPGKKNTSTLPNNETFSTSKPTKSSKIETTKKSTKHTESESISPNSVGVGILKLAGCNIYGRMYRVGRIISELSGPCLECKCTEIGVQCRNLTC